MIQLDLILTCFDKVFLATSVAPLYKQRQSTKLEYLLQNNLAELLLFILFYTHIY